MTAVIDRNLLCEAARTIRICISILCFFVIGLCASCSRQAEAPFVEGGDWRPSEQVSLQQLPMLLRPGLHPWYRALWTNGVVRHVCLEHCGIESISASWYVYIFDTEGELIEQNMVDVLSGSRPLRVASISPVRIVFTSSRMNEEEQVAEFSYTKERWPELLRELERGWETAVARRKARLEAEQKAKTE